MEQKGIRFILSRLLTYAERVIRGEATAISETATLVGTVKESMIGDLPPADLCAAQKSPVLYGLLYDSPTVHASVFGFSRTGEVIPLHDHPTMYGFVTVLRGTLKVKSFSFLDCSGKHFSGQTRVRYEGERILKKGDGCVYLCPAKGNIHEITALENGSFFFDVLFPGYGDSLPCTYFEAPDRLPSIGRECHLREISRPCNYFCCTVPLQQIVDL